MTTLKEIEEISLAALHDRIHALEEQLADLAQQEQALQEIKFSFSTPETKHPKVSEAIAQQRNTQSQAQIAQIRSNLNLDRTPLEFELSALKKLQGKKDLFFQLQEMETKMSSKVWEINNQLKEAFEEIEKLSQLDAEMMRVYLRMTEQTQIDPWNSPPYGWIARNWQRFRFQIEKNIVGGFEPFRK